MRVVFALYDSTGAPLTTATPAFATYVGSDGVLRTAPAIANRGNGLYSFVPSGLDLAVGTAYEINCGTGASPPRLSGSVGSLVAFALYDGSGAPLTGQHPAFLVYEGSPTPSIAELSGGLYGFTPSAADVARDAAYLVTAPSANPSSLAGSVGSPSADTSGTNPLPPPPPPTPLNSAAYARQLAALLPPGSVWQLEPGTWLSKVLLALSDELSRIDGRAVDLVTEADPREATEMLSDWERALGLPDAMVTSIPSADADRRVAITQKLVRTGGQTPAYFVALAAACGYSGTIDEWSAFPVLRSGFRSGARCYGSDWAFVWRMNVSPAAGAALTHGQLEAVITAAAPAHTKPIFNYL